MLDLDRDSQPLSDFATKTPEILRQLKDSGQPLVLTVDGKPELVVQDAASYQKLLHLAEQAEQTESLRVSVAEMNAGLGIPAEDVLAEMRRIHFRFG